ncbi:MAG: DUF4114 domain-containing protein, partial [Bacteroidales bacterium]|nr:DUF4114 domain-containing protein [Bacteroidales bacterium]
MKSFIIFVGFMLISAVMYSQYGTLTITSNSSEYITNVSFSNLNHTTDGTESTYEFYDDTVAYVNKGKTITLSVSIQPSSNDYLSAWIDWDGDEVFESSEKYDLISNTSSSGPFTTNITIPNSSSNGLTRMRVVLSRTNAAIATGSFTYGEAEDYLVNVSPYNYIYLGGWDNNGRPDYLEPIGDDITPDILDLINQAIPEYNDNLNYIDYNDYLNVEVDTGTRVWASFIFEGGSYKNTFAMYQYPVSDPPTSTSDIDSLTIIFPNASGNGSGLQSGGDLDAGDKVYYDSVPAGTVIAFAIIANGFNSYTNTTINGTGYGTYYSNIILNPESDDSLKAHNVTFWDSQQEKFIIGFEDINRSLSNCDHDFNDVVFYITLDPIPLFDDSLNNPPP